MRVQPYNLAFICASGGISFLRFWCRLLRFCWIRMREECHLWAGNFRSPVVGTVCLLQRKIRIGEHYRRLQERKEWISMVGVSRFLFVRWIAWWCSKWWKARFEWVLVCIGWREKRGGPLLAECCYCIPCSRKNKGFIPLALSTHTLSLRGNFRISFAACVQTVVCKIWKIILTKKGDSSFSPDFCQIKKDDLLVANRLFSAGARTRTWNGI